MINSKNLELDDIDLTEAIELCFEKQARNFPRQSVLNFMQMIKGYTKQEIDYIHHYPLILQWKIISNCNLRCKHCFFYDNKDKFNSDSDLSTQQTLDLIDILADEFNIVSITLSGGEVFLRKDIFEIIQKLKSKNISIAISTNGTLITKEIANKLSNALNPKMDIVRISLDGATAETHDKTRGTGAFEAAIQGINNLTENEIFPHVNFTITSNNVKELPQLYKLVNDLKVKNLSIAKFYLCSDNQEYLVPDENDFYKYVAKVITMEKQGCETSLNINGLKIYHFASHEIGQKVLAKHIDKYSKMQNNTEIDCRCHNHHRIDIEPDGEVFLCYLAAHNSKLSLGNIKKESLIDIWAKRHNNILFQKRDPKKMVCQKCSYFCSCKGGCPGDAHKTYCDINAPSGLCEVGKILMQNQ